MELTSLARKAAWIVALAAWPAWAAETVELAQRLRIAPGQAVSAAIPAGLATPEVSSSAREVADARIEDGRMIVTGVGEGTATVTFTAQGWSGLLGLGRAAGAAQRGYALRETIALEVGSGNAAAAGPPPATAAPLPVDELAFNGDLVLEPGKPVTIALPGGTGNVTATSSAAAVRAGIVQGALVVAAGPGAGPSATIQVRGDGPSSMLRFDGIAPAAGEGPPRYRFVETVTVKIAAAPVAANRGAAPVDANRGGAPVAANRGAAREPRDAEPATGEARKSEGAAPPVEERSVTMRMGEKRTDALPAHGRLDTMRSSNEGVATVSAKDDQVTISALREGNADIVLAGEVLDLRAGAGAPGAMRAFSQVVHVRVKGPDLSGRWSAAGGSGVVTISHTGDRIVLRDRMARPWEGTLSGDKLRLTHVYAPEDVGRMGSQWPEKVQQQLVGRKRRIFATVVGEGDALRLAGKLHGLTVKFTSSHNVTSVGEKVQDIELRRAR